MTAKSKPSLMIAGGGTGGHVLAGISVAEAWRFEYGNDVPIYFVGAQGGLEEKLVPRAGYPLDLLVVGSLNRVSFQKKLKTYVQLPLALWRSTWILLRRRPKFILGVGGYASGPVLLMARLWAAVGLLQTHVAILEQNSVPGFTNRILGKIVNLVFATFPGTEQQFPKKRVIVTGNPIRSSILPMAPANRVPFTLFIFGGSQGASRINSLVIEALPHLVDLRGQLQFIHQTGEKDYDRVLQGYFQAGFQARIEKFIHDMPAAYQDSSLVICRAGSSTLAEIAAVGRASVLIPLPTAADNHQEHNAQVYSKVGAASIFEQSTGSGEALAQLLRRFIVYPQEVQEMECKVRQFYRPHAAKDLTLALRNLDTSLAKEI